MTASPMATMGPTPVQWERGMRLRVAPGARFEHLDHSTVRTSADGVQGLYLSGTAVGAHVALEQIGLVVIDTGDITPIA
jgi:hypothetical protein